MPHSDQQHAVVVVKRRKNTVRWLVRCSFSNIYFAWT